MRFGILSDTHGQTELVKKAVTIFERAEIQEFIHCGDVGTKEIVSLLAKFPGHYVLGNTDTSSLKSWVTEFRQTYYGNVGIISREGRRIAFLHGDDWRTFDDLLYRQHFDLICYGHEHQFSWRIENETRILNPGGFTRTTPSVVTLDLPQLSIQKYVL
ncbi:MAG: metallophosphoesterase family protein [Planctomycetia bacterium]|nr:metallophosphoesterase family protein [Planctomycetia bacterium]